MERITISDIARAAGVSESSVSTALSGKRGVSEATRQRILEIAGRLGWSPSHAARSLSNSRADAIALVLARPVRLSQGPFFMQFIDGVESVIAPRNLTLMLHVVDGMDDEIRAYERWWAQRRVDGVIISNAIVGDPRIDAVRRLGVPAVWVEAEASSDSGDENGGIQQAVRYLARLGHKRIARVAGNPELVPIVNRNAQFQQLMTSLGLSPTIVDGDFSGESGAQATRFLLSLTEPPTAIIYDGDIMAVAGLGVAGEMGIPVPDELSIMSWDDSVLCEITRPALSAVRRNNSAYGALQAERLMKIIDGVQDSKDAGVAPPVLIQRGSTGRLKST